MASAPNNSSITSTSPTSSFSSTELPTDSSTITSSSDTSLTSSSSSETTSSSIPTSSSESLPTSSIESETSASITSPSQAATTSIVFTSSADGTTIIETSTSTRAVSTDASESSSSSATEAAASASSTNPTLASGSNSGDDGGLKQGPKIAIAVVVPVVVIALLILAGLWFWKKRKQTKDAEDLRRKEMEEYGFNPNNDPTVPAVGGGSTNGDETSTAREQDAGYRGWGGTTTASNTRKASTTMSSNPGMARSDSGGNGYKGQHSPTGNMTQISDGHSGDPLVGHGDETIGALGAAPAASGNRGVNRGPSNASSAYSAANRSDVSALSGDGPLPNGSPPYPQDYMYPDESNQHGWDGQPVIREVSARRNTRIENPSVVPQQGNAGIAQNF